MNGVLVGVVENGKIRLTTPVGDVAPGFGAMVELIGLSAVKDLYVQKEKKKLGAILKKVYKKTETEEADTEDTQEAQTEYASEGSVPKVSYKVESQRDIDLERTIIPRKYVTHPVLSHKMSLPGWKGYRHAIKMYRYARRLGFWALKNDEVKNWEAAKELMTELAPAVIEARDRMSKINEDKALNWDPNLSQVGVFIFDPVASKRVHKKTWVAAHTRPKLTEEKIHENILFKRFYKVPDKPVTALGELNEEFGDLLAA